MSRKITIEDIARQSNASPSTVSLVLRNRPGISSQTRQRVLDAARALGYRRRAAPPDEPSRETLTVGMALRARSRTPDVGLPVVNPFYSWVVAGMDAAAREQRLNLLYASIPVDQENQPLDLPRHLLDQTLDGLLPGRRVRRRDHRRGRGHAPGAASCWSMPLRRSTHTTRSSRTTRAAPTKPSRT